MTKLAFLVLAHNRPLELIQTVKMLTDNGDYAAIHYDRNAPQKDFALLQSELGSNENVRFVRRRKCGWGGWSLVGATLDMLRAAEAQFEDATHFFLISGACAPIKSRAQIGKALQDDPQDFIEAFDLVRSDWIKTGMKEDRFKYRHFFNERRQTRLFYNSLNAQRRFGWHREPPLGLEMKVGSQWWCLRRKTIEAVLSYIDENPQIVRFFRTTWIPDESFFQSIVTRLVPTSEIKGHPPTLLMFTDYGVPVTFHADHFDFLKRQPGLFARKISTTSPALRDSLMAHYASGEIANVPVSDPRQHYRMVADAGRTGDRFKQRIWERASSVAREKHLLIVCAKRWDEGDWLRRAISSKAGIPGVGYVFNTNAAELPDLGGLEAYVDKRARHRRAVANLLFETFETDKLVISLDPESTDVLDDLAKDRCAVSVIFVDKPLDEAYFRGHAERTGQVHADQSDDDWQVVYRSLREKYDRCVAELQHPRLYRYSELRASDTHDRRSEVLSRSLDCDGDTATEILNTSDVFKEAEHA